MMYSLVCGTTDNQGVVLLQIMENPDFLWADRLLCITGSPVIDCIRLLFCCRFFHNNGKSKYGS